MGSKTIVIPNQAILMVKSNILDPMSLHWDRSPRHGENIKYMMMMMMIIIIIIDFPPNFDSPSSNTPLG